MDLVVGVDIGTTAATAVVYDADGREHGSGSAGYDLIESPGRAVQDSVAVTEATLEAIRTAVAGAGPIAGLAWFRETEPDLFARARRWAGIKELVLRRLTGRWAIDVSCASA